MRFALLSLVFSSIVLAAYNTASSSAAPALAFSPLATTNKTLILFDESIDADFENSYSQFLSLVNLNGFSYDLQPASKVSEAGLFNKRGHRLYDNVVVFPSKQRVLTKQINYETLERFANKGGNFVFVSSNQGTQTDASVFLNQLGIFPSPKNYRFIDYHRSKSQQSQVISVEHPVFLNDVVVPDSLNISELAYGDGAVAILDNSQYLIPLLKASESSITYDVDRGLISSDSTWHSGSQGFLVAAYEARNNARTLWLGSESLLKNGQLNSLLAEHLLRWAFQINGVIQADFFQHRLVDKYGAQLEQDGDAFYKIKDYCKFEIGISEWNGFKWTPFNASDVQFEFVMLDPYYRLTLPYERNKRQAAVYSTVFRIPDHHGMFTFKVDYTRPGLSYIEESTVVPVRHLANDEYPRSWEITNSWVYMASFVVVVVGWLLFVVVYIYSGKKSKTE